jgi:hypothetical protein
MITQIQNTINAINHGDFNPYFTMEDVFKFKALSSFLNSNFNKINNYERMLYFNMLVVFSEQVRLGYLYSDSIEKSLIIEVLTR